MQTESLGQMVDRLIIAALKVFHYRQAGNGDAASEAQVQVDQLSIAVEVYDWECRTGQRTPQVRRQLRFHNHNDVEAFRPGKQATPNVPGTLSGCVVALVEAHSGYWEKQSRLQTLKKLMDGAPAQERGYFHAEFVRTQRATDLHNQHRSQVVQQIDTLYAVDLGRKPDLDPEALKADILRTLDERSKQGSFRDPMEAVRS